MNQKINLITTLGMCCLLSACQCSQEKKAEKVAAPAAMVTETMPATKESSTMTTIKTPSNLEYIITREGTGASVKKGDTVTVHYTGHIYNKDTNTLGAKFDSSVDRGEPFSFKIGYNTVIKGWEEGILGMKIGEKRTLIIPAELGYGSRGAGRVITPGATLHFDVELLSIS